jgi:rRNA-processing protein FCF1
MFSIIETLLLLAIIYLVLQQKPGGIGGFSIGSRRRKIILDSCALIDGRVVEIVRSGFIADELLVPQFVLNELQLLADGSDTHKRERARFGLDVARELQELAPNDVTIDRDMILNVPTTDDKLLVLTKKRKAQLYTTDYNLAKVAAVEGVAVLNVNELAQSLRPVTLPGETLSIKIIQKGTNRDQGVGYLDDGTMIVVDGAARLVGKSVPVTVSRMHQTVAGKMVFGQVKEQPRQDRQQQSRSYDDREDRKPAPEQSEEESRLPKHLSHLRQLPKAGSITNRVRQFRPTGRRRIVSQ